MKLSTVNVIESVEGSIIGVVSYPDIPEGNVLAEIAFTERATENGFDADEIEVGIDDGHLEKGTYDLFLVHSN